MNYETVKDKAIKKGRCVKCGKTKGDCVSLCYDCFVDLKMYEMI